MSKVCQRRQIDIVKSHPKSSQIFFVCQNRFCQPWDPALVFLLHCEFMEQAFTRLVSPSLGCPCSVHSSLRRWPISLSALPIAWLWHLNAVFKESISSFPTDFWKLPRWLWADVSLFCHSEVSNRETVIWVSLQRTDMMSRWKDKNRKTDLGSKKHLNIWLCGLCVPALITVFPSCSLWV